jgi:uncharacterized Zn-binding protein involved in type VI secretion
MGQPAAKQNDRITAVDIHIVMVPSINGQIPVPLPHPFDGRLNGNLSPNVKIMGLPAATVGSLATNQSPHFPLSPGVAFQVPPSNQGTVTMGSSTVKINGKPAARLGDSAQTCADPMPNNGAKVVVAASTVMIG